MFGCFRRLTTLVVLAVAAVAAFATRDLWLPRLRAAIGGATAATGVASDSSASVVADTGWSGLSFGAAEQGRRALARMSAPKGPAFVRLSAGAFASAVLDSLAAQLPASADSVQVRTVGNEFQVRARVRLGDVGGRAALGPLASMLGDRERLLLGGTIEPTGVPGVAQFKLTRVQVGDFAVPGPVVPRLVKALKRGASAPGVDLSALTVRLPDGIGDIRVAQGIITIYRTIP